MVWLETKFTPIEFSFVLYTYRRNMAAHQTELI